MMLGVIERKLQTFAKELGGSIKKMEKDRFLLVISKESLDKVIEGKFKILEEITKRSGGVKLREDNILFTMSIKLKDMCN